MAKKKNVKVGLIVDDGNLKNVAKNSKKAQMIIDQVGW